MTLVPSDAANTLYILVVPCWSDLITILRVEIVRLICFASFCIQRDATTCNFPWKCVWFSCRNTIIILILYFVSQRICLKRGVKYLDLGKLVTILIVAEDSGIWDLFKDTILIFIPLPNDFIRSTVDTVCLVRFDYFWPITTPLSGGLIWHVHDIDHVRKV